MLIRSLSKQVYEEFWVKHKGHNFYMLNFFLINLLIWSVQSSCISIDIKICNSTKIKFNKIQTKIV